jgi:hypothetical protein
MALISTCVIFLGPLIYIENKELIDGQLQQASDVIGQQTSQLRDLTAQHTSKGLDTMKQYTGTAAARAQDLVGTARQKIPTPATSTKTTTQESDFPAAPRTELPHSDIKQESEPLLAS